MTAREFTSPTGTGKTWQEGGLGASRSAGISRPLRYYGRVEYADGRIDFLSGTNPGPVEAEVRRRLGIDGDVA